MLFTYIVKFNSWDVLLSFRRLQLLVQCWDTRVSQLLVLSSLKFFEPVQVDASCTLFVFAATTTFLLARTAMDVDVIYPTFHWVAKASIVIFRTNDAIVARNCLSQSRLSQSSPTALQLLEYFSMCLSTVLQNKTVSICSTTCPLLQVGALRAVVDHRRFSGCEIGDKAHWEETSFVECRL